MSVSALWRCCRCLACVCGGGREVPGCVYRAVGRARPLGCEALGLCYAQRGQFTEGVGVC